MGSFNLPPEITCQILEQLDFTSLGQMRCLNSQIRSLVDTLPAYRDVVKHTPHILRVLALTGAASLFSANHIYAALRDSRCFLCPNFGPYIYLPTCSRCCTNCLDYHPGTNTVPASDAAIYFRLSETVMRQIPVVKTIPGTYSHGFSEVVHQIPVPVVNVQAAFTRCSTEYGSTPRVAIQSSKFSPCSYMVSTPFPFLDKRLNKTEPGILCGGCNTIEKWLGRDDGADYFKASRARKKRQTAFSEEELLWHFEDCEDAQTLWDQHKELKAFERETARQLDEWEAQRRRIMGSMEDWCRTLAFILSSTRGVTNRRL